MQRLPIGILGASGYSGMEATRILAFHPGVELRVLGSDKWAGDTVAKRLGSTGGADALKYATQADAERLARECAAVLLATPAEASLQLAPGLVRAGVKVVDLSGAFRIKDAARYAAAYGHAHHEPELLAEAVYGLPELSDCAAIAKARLVANPGCYPTAAALALAPLLSLLTNDPLIVDAASGVTGAGRKATEELSFSEVHDDFKAYRALRHQHTPEIAQTLGRKLTFTPHLLPVRRGILATAYGWTQRSAGELREALLHKYAAEPFVTVLGGPDEPALRHVVNTNRCVVGVGVSTAPEDAGRVVVTSAIDNLVKGAAGQAVQNLNLMLGFAETTGLSTLRGTFP